MGRQSTRISHKLGGVSQREDVAVLAEGDTLQWQHGRPMLLFFGSVVHRVIIVVKLSSSATHRPHDRYRRCFNQQQWCAVPFVGVGHCVGGLRGLDFSSTKWLLVVLDSWWDNLLLLLGWTDGLVEVCCRLIAESLAGAEKNIF